MKVRMSTGLFQKIETRERLSKQRDGLGTITLNLTGEDSLYMIIEENYGPRQGDNHGWFYEPEYIYTTTLQEVILVKQPSKEEIAATESVTKAQEALYAAERALIAIKERKK